MANRKANWKQWQILFSWAPKSLQMVTAAMKLKDACLLLGRKAMKNLVTVLKSRDITLQTKVRIVKAIVFLVVMYRCESWTLKKAESQRIGAFELWCWRRLLRVPWTARISKPVTPTGNQPWIFIGRTVDEAEALILWPPDARSWLIGKDPDAGKDWGQEKKGAIEDEMVRWHQGFNGHEFEQTVGDREAWHATVPWVHKESDTTTEQQQQILWTSPHFLVGRGISDHQGPMGP